MSSTSKRNQIRRAREELAKRRVLKNKRRILLVGLIVALLILAVPNLAHGQTTKTATTETVTLNIDGEQYERDIPKTYDEVVTLLKGVVAVQNKADADFVAYKKVTETEYVKLSKLTAATTEIASLKSQLATIQTKYDAFAKTSVDMAKKNTSFTSFLTVGPSLSTLGQLGTSVGLIGEWRLFDNIHAGLNLNLSVYNNSRIDGSLGLVIGYSLY